MPAPKPSSRADADNLRSARLEAALERAVRAGDTVELYELLTRSGGVPGPRPNIDFARAVGLAIAGYGGKADTLLRALATGEDEFRRIVAAVALAARSLAGVDAKRALIELQELAEDSRHTARAGVVEALRMRIRALGDAAVEDLSSWTDGYLQAHVVLEALADRDLLTTLSAGAPVLARLDEAFALANTSARAAERSQGVRTLRQELPKQIAIFAGRYPETLDWLEHAAAAKRPETRQVVEETIHILRKKVLSDAAAQRLSVLLAASAKAPRDPSRLVKGTRKRSKGRA